VHAPTIYFPSLVDEALMIEVPETESRRELDELAAAFRRAVGDSDENLHAAPRSTSVARIDEVLAARQLILAWKDLRETPVVPPAPPTP
jgi:glycine dehydrogenase subunit 2